MTRCSYYVGLDLGQSMDYTALCVIEEPVWIADEDDKFYTNAPAVGWVSPAAFVPAQLQRVLAGRDGRDAPAKPPLSARHLERMPLGTPYPAIVDRVERLLSTDPLRGRPTYLIVDATGVGAPVVDLFRARGLEPIAVTITGGTTVNRADYGALHVPKRDLISTVAVLLEQRRLAIAASLPEAATLVKELAGFQRRVSKAGNDQYEASWREAPHDDLVLAVALAAWYREWYNTWLDQTGPSRMFDRHGNPIGAVVRR